MTEQAAKVALSPFELELVSDVAWIYAKNQIVEKTAVLLGAVAAHLQSVYTDPSGSFPACLKQSPKISRGEAYEELPWLMLDFPREFQGEDWLAVRHFFSWGRGFTVSLLLRGIHLDRALGCLERHWSNWQQAGLAQVTGSDPWKHHANPTMQRLLAEITREELTAMARAQGFLQIRKHLPIQEWAGAVLFMKETHQAFLPLIQEIGQI
jgi:hypothetical protein